MTTSAPADVFAANELRAAEADAARLKASYEQAKLFSSRLAGAWYRDWMAAEDKARKLRQAMRKGDQHANDQHQ